MVPALHVGRLLQRDDRQAVALHALGMDALDVIALVERRRRGHRTSPPRRVQQVGDEPRFVGLRRLHRPSDGKVGRRANRSMQPIAVEAAALAGRDGAAVSPARVRV